MPDKKRLLTVSIFIFGLSLLFVAQASAEWRVSIESKSVYPSQTGVSVDLELAFDAPIGGLAIPLMVKEITPGSFWAGVLPVDTGGSVLSPT